MASWPLAECALKGLKWKLTEKASTRPKPRLPILPELLRSMKFWGILDRFTWDNVMLWGVCCTCLFGFLRSGEVTVPSQHDYD